jgi:2,4-dienoyl-CoA reductase-like NADH-dependent reductase (Old Yellow Enzyme family)/NADPH-dependent 2,4-dienoyl-CoA reductase/sulfur reductase-like enzyme
MSRPTFDHLLEPGRIGPLRLSSRVILPAMDMNHCDDGAITGTEIDHYRARAAGGAGMVITGSGAVAFPVGAASRKQPGLSDDRFVPGLAQLADAVHEAGSLLCVQLTHHGKTARVDIAEGRPLLVPSRPTGRPDMSSLRDCTEDEVVRLAAASAGGNVPTYREADEDDILWLIDQFAAAAGRVRDAGADAVEVHAAHGYVLSTFLARADNRRIDRWGGTLENRARLTAEVLAAVRTTIGSEMALLVRVSGREFGDDGALTLDESTAASRMFVEAGADAIHVTGWGRNSFANFTDGPLPDTVAPYRADAKAMRDAVDVPVIAVGRLLPEVAEEMLAEGECDFVAMGRQLLADPDLTVKLRAGRRESVRPCINCYVCVEQNFYDAAPRCAVNPALGDETLVSLPPIRRQRHVVVVGGGPGGMETARIAAELGHRVTLIEAADRLGGTAWFSQLTTPANGPLIDWQAHELARLGVDVRLGTTATADRIGDLHPDVVVVATGASRGLPPVPGVDRSHVWSGDDLRAAMTGFGPTPPVGPGARVLLWAGRALRLTRTAARVRVLSRWWLPLGRRVVILGGGLVGLELAEFLAARRRTVTVLEPGPAAGLPMATPRRWATVRHATSHGVEIVRGATVVEITAEDVVYDVGSDGRRAPADTVIVAGEVRPGSPLADQLEASGVAVHVVGDAGEVGYIEGAIHSAWHVARAI